MRISLVGWLVSLVLLAGCGGRSTPPPAQQGNLLTGNWQLTFQPLHSTSLLTQSGFLTQTGNSVTGSLTGSFGNCAGVSPVSGTLNGSSVSISVDESGQTLSLTGNVSSDSSSMSGGYEILLGGCGAAQTGSWAAIQVKPLNGNFHGTFKASAFDSSGNHPQYNVSGTIAQSANINALASLSGTIASSNSPCFSSATITGTISGTTAQMQIFSSNGLQIGEFGGTITADARTLPAPTSTVAPASYQFNPGVCDLNSQSDGMGLTVSNSGTPSITFP